RAGSHPGSGRQPQVRHGRRRPPRHPRGNREAGQGLLQPSREAHEQHAAGGLEGQKAVRRLRSPMELDWNDTEEIALQLMERHPDTDPLTIRFTDLHQWVTAIPGFIGDARKSNEKILEAIQMAWHEEYKDAHGYGARRTSPLTPTEA